jgi:hypothetical protein
MIDIKGLYTWHITTKGGDVLPPSDVDFIKTFNPTIYHNDIECYLWAFDTKLPSGLWLENMRFSNYLTTCDALVIIKGV